MADPPVVVSKVASLPSSVRWGRGLATLLAPLGLLGLVEWAGLSVCPLQNTVGVPCPGCGLTRASFAALRGDFAEATHFHPMVWVITPLVALVWAQIAWRAANLPVPRWTQRLASPPRPLAWLLLVALLGLWIARFFGAFGGPVDPVDPSRGLLTRLLLSLA